MKEILANFDLVPVDFYMIIVGGISFVVFWQIFGNWVAKPFANLVRAREQATVGVDAAVASVRTETEAVHDAIEKALTEVRVEEMRAKLEAIAKAKSAADQVVGNAESKAQEIIKAGKANAESLLKALREQTGREAEGLARTMAEKAKASILMQ